ncbi:MAG: L-threonylcarbamoyladenylate synthase [Gammaproteobacteria bacterium]|nr:L-threonylcarbamoyladenylate synthase [Gammaproteobacteria bacterium]
MNHWHLHLAVRVLRRGGVVLHPTEGVWGLACDPWNAAAVEALLHFKQRPANKGLIVVGAAAGCFEAELSQLEPSAQDRVLASWPGPVTWLLPSERFPEWITGGRDTVAVRVPGHAGCRDLCRAFGSPLVSTSANRSGAPPARNRFQARAWLRDTCRDRAAGGADAALRHEADLYLLPGETLGRRRPSDLRTIQGDEIRRER